VPIAGHSGRRRKITIKKRIKSRSRSRSRIGMWDADGGSELR